MTCLNLTCPHAAATPRTQPSQVAASVPASVPQGTWYLAASSTMKGGTLSSSLKPSLVAGAASRRSPPRQPALRHGGATKLLWGSWPQPARCSASCLSGSPSVPTSSPTFPVIATACVSRRLCCLFVRGPGRGCPGDFIRLSFAIGGQRDILRRRWRRFAGSWQAGEQTTGAARRIRSVTSAMPVDSAPFHAEARGYWRDRIRAKRICRNRVTRRIRLIGWGRAPIRAFGRQHPGCATG